MSKQSDQAATVFIVDDDPAIRFAMQALMDSVNLKHEIYGSGDEFLQQFTDERPGCLVLDIRMPGLGGLELQEELLKRGNSLPVIFITGHGDVPMAVSAMKDGAVDFLTKPFQEGELLEKVKSAITYYQSSREHMLELQDLQTRVDSCTPREQDVMRLLAKGLPNKGIAETLGISPRTVGIHRANVMDKMTADSLPALVRMITTLESGKI